MYINVNETFQNSTKQYLISYSAKESRFFPEIKNLPVILISFSVPNLGIHKQSSTGFRFVYFSVRSISLSVSRMSVNMTVDPRSRASVHLYSMPTTDAPGTFAQMISLFLGVVALTMRNKLAAWSSLFVILHAFATLKKSEVDTKQIGIAIMFALMGLMINYFSPGFPVK